VPLLSGRVSFLALLRIQFGGRIELLPNPRFRGLRLLYLLSLCRSIRDR